MNAAGRSLQHLDNPLDFKPEPATSERQHEAMYTTDASQCKGGLSLTAAVNDIWDHHHHQGSYPKTALVTCRLWLEQQCEQKHTCTFCTLCPSSQSLQYTRFRELLVILHAGGYLPCSYTCTTSSLHCPDQRYMQTSFCAKLLLLVIPRAVLQIKPDNCDLDLDNALVKWSWQTL